MTPQLRAEAATLGSLLLDADTGRTLRWLRVEDFTDPWHRELYATLRDTAASVADPAGLRAALLDRLGPRRADLHRIPALLQATPVRPQPQRYAAMLVEASLRRSLTQQGLLLRAGALQARVTVTRQPVHAAAALVTAAVEAAAVRWAQATGTVVALSDAGAELRQRRDAERVLLGADRFLATQPRPDPGLNADHEQALIAALLAHPGDVAAVAAWLQPSDFADPTWAAVYAAVVDLSDAGTAVDEVTVAWQVRHNEPVHGPGPDAAVFADALANPPVAPVARLAEHVALDVLRRTADRAAAALTAATANPGVGMPDLLDTTQLLTDAVVTSARGLPLTPEPVAGPGRPRHLTLVPAPAAAADAVAR